MSLKSRFYSWFLHLQKFSNRIWFGFVIGFLAGADNIFVVVPTDGILISSTLLSPKRWVYFGICVGVGSTFGALILAYLVEHDGVGVLSWILPDFEQTKTWLWTQSFFESYGLWVVFGVSLTPLPQHAAIILAALSHSPLAHIFWAAMAGRVLKYLIMAYIASHMPQLVRKLWGVRDEVEEIEHAKVSEIP